MANKDIYTLNDLQGYARRKFPRAYHCLNKLCSYDFAWQPLRLPGAAIVEARALQISSELFKQPLIAYTNGREVLYYHHADNMLHCQTRSHVGHGALLHPCYYVKEHDSPIKRTRMSEEEIERLSLLIKYIFLKRDKITHIWNDHLDDVLLQFEALCHHMQQAVLDDPNRKTITSQPDSQTKNKQTIASTTPCSTVPEAETMSNPVPTPSSKAIAPRKRPRLNRAESYIPRLQLETQKTTSPLLDQAETQFQQLMTTLQQHKTESEAAFARSKVEVDEKVKAATTALGEEKKKRVATEKLVLKQGLEIANLNTERNAWRDKFENEEEECENLKGKLQELKKRVRGLVDEE